MALGSAVSFRLPSGQFNALQANAVSTSLLPSTGPRGFKSILTCAGEERRRVLFEGWQEARDVRRPASDRRSRSVDSGEVVRAVVHPRSITDGRRLAYEGVVGELPHQEVGDIRP
jgi:hypothetical protein